MTLQAPEKEKARDVSGGPKPRRWIRRTVAVIGVILVIAYLAVAWIVAGRVIDSLRVSPASIEYDTDVISVSETEITIGVPDEDSVEADRDAVMGLRWDGGYGRVGPATSFDDETETRPFSLITGVLPPLGADIADFDSFAFPTDPTAAGFDYETVTFQSDLGELEAWHFPGESDTWIIAVHGLGSDRPEFLRMVDATADLDHPILAIRYRNDPSSPATEGSLVLVGQEEYRDVMAAVDFALANGATDVVLYGPSMGGALTLSYALEESRDVISGLILEAPVADMRELVSLRSGEALPVGGVLGDSILGVARLIASIRTGVDFDTVDYVDRAGDLDVPILLFHGMDDPKVPFAIGEGLFQARPDLIEFHVVAGGAHVRAWNEDPEGFASILARFLGEVAR